MSASKPISIHPPTCYMCNGNSYAPYLCKMDPKTTQKIVLCSESCFESWKKFIALDRSKRITIKEKISTPPNSLTEEQIARLALDNVQENEK